MKSSQHTNTAAYMHNFNIKWKVNVYVTNRHLHSILACLNASLCIILPGNGNGNGNGKS